MLLQSFNTTSDALDKPVEAAATSHESIPFYEGMAAEAGKGIALGGARAAFTAGIIGGLVPNTGDYIRNYIFDTPDDHAASDWYYKTLEDVTTPAMDFYKADTENSSHFAQGVNKFSSIVTEVLLTRASGAASTEYTNNKLDYINQGYDEHTANSLAVLDAATTYVGVKAPVAAGQGLWTKVLTGGSAGAILGETDQQARHSILTNNGYDAKEIKMFDASLAAMNFVLGGATGAISHLAPKQFGAIENKTDLKQAVGEFLDLDSHSVDLINGLVDKSLTIQEKNALLHNYVKSELRRNTVNYGDTKLSVADTSIQYAESGDIDAIPLDIEQAASDIKIDTTHDKIVEDQKMYSKYALYDESAVTPVGEISDPVEDIGYDIGTQSIKLDTNADTQTQIAPFTDANVINATDKALAKLKEIGDTEGAAELRQVLAEVQDDSKAMQSVINCFLGR